jgi:enamine deaminase RidA (YjgF/YER057c/UK114 family)
MQAFAFTMVTRQASHRRAMRAYAPRTFPHALESSMAVVRLAVLSLPLLLCTVVAARAAEVVRHLDPSGKSSIARAVEVPSDKTVVYLSGAVPGVSNTGAPKDSLEAYGDTRTQTLNVLKRIDEQLKELGLTMGDVVKMQAFLVGGPETGGKMDSEGYRAAYAEYFGTQAQPKLPARSTLQIAGLAHPAFRVEIEVVAVRP